MAPMLMIAHAIVRQGKLTQALQERGARIAAATKDLFTAEEKDAAVASAVAAARQGFTVSPSAAPTPAQPAAAAGEGPR